MDVEKSLESVAFSAKGVVSWIHGIACVDTFCQVKWGDKVGIADFETTNNAMRGGYRPYVAINAIEPNGLHPVGR